MVVIQKTLNDDQRRRYARHILLPEIGETGQEKLLHSKVLVIGAGGLGAASLSYLAAAGIGTLGIMDGDHVELSNLQRQIIHEEGDLGRLKVESAADRLSELNSDTAIEIHPRRFTVQNGEAIFRRYDLLLDGSDNFATRFAINAVATRLRKPWVFAAIKGFSGQMASFTPYAGADYPCYQCYVAESPPEANHCRDTGVAGPFAGMVGTYQAMEAIKLLLGIGTPLTKQILYINGLHNTQRMTQLHKDPACKACNPHVR